MPCHQQALSPHEGDISQYVGQVTAHSPLKDREGHKLNYARSQTPPPPAIAKQRHHIVGSMRLSPGSGSRFLGWPGEVVFPSGN